MKNNFLINKFDFHNMYGKKIQITILFINTLLFLKLFINSIVQFICEKKLCKCIKKKIILGNQMSYRQ